MNLDDPGGKVTYASRSGSGKKVIFKDVTIRADPENTIKIKEMEFGGLTMTEGGDPLFRRLRMSGLEPGEAVNGLSLSLKSVSLDEPSEEVAAYIAAGLSEAGAQAAPAFSSWDAGSFSLEGFALSADLAEMGEGSGSLSLELASASLSDLRETVFGELSLKGLKGTFDIPADPAGGFPVSGSFDLGDMEIGGLRGAVFAQALAASALSPFAPPAQPAGGTSPIDPGYDSLSWSGASLTMSGVDLSVSPVEASVERDAAGLAVSASTPRTSISLSADAQGGELGALLGGALGTLGYETVELYAEGEARFDPATDTTRYEGYTIGLTDGFDLRVSAGLKGLRSVLAGLTAALDPAASPGAVPDLSGLSLVDLDLVLTDNSLTDRLLSLSGFFGAADKEALRADLVGLLEATGQDMAAAGLAPDISASLSAALADFIRKPGVLTIKMKPGSPVALSQMAEQGTDASALGFSAAYSEKP